MALAEKMKQARLEAGLSQRQLCGDTITRNMLSQIENGAAKPSMDTLRILAGRLGKPVSYFLEEDVVASINQQVMEQARNACFSADFRGTRRILEEYRDPDPLFDAEFQLLQRITLLELARQGLREQRTEYARSCLEEIGEIRDGYCARLLEQQRRTLAAELRMQDVALPDYDDELIILARSALDAGNPVRSGHLLDGMLQRDTPQWNFLRGQVFEKESNFKAAAGCYHRAEETMGDAVFPRLEVCYREMGDFRLAYEYACRQRRS